MHDRALIVGDEGQAVAVEQDLEPVAQAVAHPARDLAGVGALDLLNGRVAGEAGERVRGQRAADVGTVLARGETGCHQLGIFLLAAHAAGAGIAAGHDLAEDGEIGHDVEIRLRAAERHAETGDNLVEDQTGSRMTAAVPPVRRLRLSIFSSMSRSFGRTSSVRLKAPPGMPKDSSRPRLPGIFRP